MTPKEINQKIDAWSKDHYLHEKTYRISDDGGSCTCVECRRMIIWNFLAGTCSEGPILTIQSLE